MTEKLTGLKVAYGSVPKDSGTFTFYRNLRPELLLLGVDLRCVSLGRQQAILWDDLYADDGCVLLAPDTRHIKAQSMAFYAWCEQEAIDIVIGVNSVAILSAIQHLPERIRVLSRCANAFDHGYKITLSGQERLAGIVATTPRLQQDLIRLYGAKPDLISLVPNGIAPAAFNSAYRVPGRTNDAIEIGFIGRLEHKQKGVFHLPEIVSELNRRGIRFKLRIAGKGKHRSIIEREMHREVASGEVEFLGAIDPGAVPEFLTGIDILLFTSHFEGCPNALLEALMAGCVPVSWKIEGITNHIIVHNRTGFLSEIGNYATMGEQIEFLANNRPYLKACSEHAARDARQRFNSTTTAKAYAALFFDVMTNEPPPWEPLPWKKFRIDPNFSQTWHKRLLSAVRRHARAVLGQVTAPRGSSR